MKKILKEGQKKFTATCSKCGCEFEYELEDIDCGSVVCPCCGERVSHPSQVGYRSISPYPFPTIPVTNNLTSWPDCETCPNKPDPAHPVVGDSPCTWCIKNRPYCSAVSHSEGKK